MQRANGTELLRSLERKERHTSAFSRRSRKGKKTGSQEPQSEVESEADDLTKDIEAVQTIRDINEELHMILRVVEQQFKVLERFKPPTSMYWRKHLTEFQGRINALSREAGAINDMVSLSACDTNETLFTNVRLLTLRSSSKPLVSNKRNLPRARIKLAHARTKWCSRSLWSLSSL
jgi:hypothetical protein